MLLLLAACSAGTDPNSLMGGGGRSRGYSTGRDDQTSTPSPKPKPAGSGNNGSSPTPQPSSTTPPSPTGSSTTPPPPPPPPAPEGSCANPKCAGVSGLCGCRATDGAGNLVLLGCSDGACVCTKLDQVTDGPVDEGGACGDQMAMKALFTSTCTCL